MSSLARNAVVAVKRGADVYHKYTGSEFPCVDDVNAQDRVLIGTGVDGCVLGADLRPAGQVGATNVHERGVIMEKLRESVHVMLVPRPGEARGKLSRDIRLAHF